MRCKHFGFCGGCLYQDVPYEEQLKQKAKVLQDLGLAIQDVIPSPQQWYYRNRMDYVFAFDVLGLRKRGDYKTVIPLQECLIFSEKMPELFALFHKLIEKYQLPSHDYINHTGYLKYFVLREMKFSQQRMLIVTTGDDSQYEEPMALFLDELFASGFFHSIYWLINASKSDLSIGLAVKKILGKETIYEQLGNKRFLLKPQSFFQSNSFVAKRMFDAMKEHLNNDKALELFSGVGTIGLYVSEKLQALLGVELVEEAVLLAQENAKLNGIEHAAFFHANAKKIHFEAFDPEKKFTTLIVDPPRAGLEKLARKIVKDGRFKKILYMSCNPKSFVKDKALLEQQYQLKWLKAFDMFPHTPHVELLGVFEKK